jgi:pyridoxamine 5'-phosphate oxidase family protein
MVESRGLYDVFVFSDAELDFLRSQRIARLATVGPSGWPHVVPVMYAINDDGSLDFDVDGVKLRNVKAEPRAAIVVDAMGPKRGIAMQGNVELLTPERARLVPARKFAWGL